MTTVLFLCHHNAGRSQLGAALLEHIAGDQFTVTTAGISPAEHVNDAVARSLDELGIDIRDRVPRAVTAAELATADVVIAMKPNLTLPAEPGGEYLVWQFPDPASWDAEDVRELRDSVEVRLRAWVESAG